MLPPDGISMELCSLPLPVSFTCQELKSTGSLPIQNSQEMSRTKVVVPKSINMMTLPDQLSEIGLTLTDEHTKYDTFPASFTLNFFFLTSLRFGLSGPFKEIFTIILTTAILHVLYETHVLLMSHCHR